MEENTLIEKPKIGPFFWIVLIAIFLLIAVFLVRQMFFLPVSADTLAALVVDESKEKTDSLKKYFPKPYSIEDLKKGDL
ncbi:MAG: hypothetical protein IKP23_01715 [Elusimicrobiaceae bacterium]|nr:hypothetical protein [Elusimicrobiaceae bacterium]